MESYVERWVREQKEIKKVQLSTVYGTVGNPEAQKEQKAARKGRKKVNNDGRAEKTPGQTEGEQGQ